MQNKFVFVSICFCLLLFFSTAGWGESYAGETNDNVITALDTGGGDLSSRDIVLIILGAIGVFFLILFVYLLIFQIGMD